MHKFLVPLSLGCLIPIASASVMEEIIVTADFRNTIEANTTSSIYIIEEETILASSAQHLDDLIDGIPNLNYSSGTSRTRFFQIRGIGERSQFGSPLNPSVGYIVDNVDFSGIGSIGTMLDVQQVEVLRGPQGTLYGANALAGLINIKTNDPGDTQFAKLRLTAGEYNHRTASMILNQPLTDKVSSRLVAEQHSSDGYYENNFLGKRDTNDRDELTLKAKLKVDISDNWRINFSLGRVDIDNGYDTFSLDNTRDTLSDEPGRDSQKSNFISVQSDTTMQSADLQVIVAAAKSDIEYSYDEDWTFTGFDPIGYTSFDSYKRDREIMSLETRLISNENSRIFRDTTDWLVGVYFLASDEDLLREYTFLDEDFRSQYDYETTALFAQFDTDLTDSWVMSMGARVERRTTDYQNSDEVGFDPDETLWGGRFSLKHHWNEATMVYASLARGYKAGGFNTDGSLDEDLREFDSEYLWELETGIKTYINDSLLLRVALFYDQRYDQQVKSSLVRQRPDGSTEFIDYLGNAAEGTNAGLEIETRWQISDAFSVNANLGLLDATFDEFINEFGEDLSGRDQSQAPSYSYQLGLHWQQVAWSADIFLNGKDEYFFSDRHSLKSERTNLLNANVAYENERIRISLWGRNLTDEDHTVRGFGSFGNDPKKGYITEPYVQFGEPRIIGLTFEIAVGE